MDKKWKGIPDGIPYEDLIASEEEGMEMIRFYYEHFHVYYDDVYRLIRSRAPKLELEYVEELRQETILRALEYYKTLRDVNSARAWLFTIASNLVKAHYTELNREADMVTSMPLLYLDEDVPSYGLMDHLDFTMEEVMRRCDKEILMDYLNQLSEEQRYVIKMHHYYDLTFQEIADIRKVKRCTAYGWYRRGCARLRRMIKTKGGRWDE